MNIKAILAIVVIIGTLMIEIATLYLSYTNCGIVILMIMSGLIMIGDAAILSVIPDSDYKETL